MSTPPKTAWRARLRAARAAADAASRAAAGTGLARVGLDWVESLAAAAAPAGGPPADAAPLGGLSSGAFPGTGPPAARLQVCAYISTGTEPSTDELLSALAAAGHLVHVPVCEPGFALSWVRWFPGVAMVRSALAPVMEPVGVRRPFPELGPVPAVLVPALAVDESGTRMGQGGGYYDRFLAGLAGSTASPGTRVTVAAVVHSNEILSAGMLPRDTFDMPVSWALSPSGVRRLGG
ncbi:5-formyltetrahydrofolate cyclo-ligase [Arthrobacter stackebrandtii]|uniref:5-formyltetrahydrofolate cyclo-ligase n=1 Tax=Arthrobacter stackebrandtii TaxID=272161 RepID=A0ABS4YY86_9MICC|nr:5-formyltetrahydrofolate cyclo-ligase [Arthrobacter stackebrandtii]